MTNKRKFAAICIVIALLGSMFCTFGFAIADDSAPVATDGEAMILMAADDTLTTGANTAFSVDVDGETVDYDLSDGDSAHAYVDAYADNLGSDPDFKAHIETAIAKVRESIGSYASILALLPPVIAIVLALITKEVYSSLVIGIVVGGFIFAGGNFETAINHVLSERLATKPSNRTWLIAVSKLPPAKMKPPTTIPITSDE